MTAKKTDLSFYDPESVPDGSGYRIGILVSSWNEEITGALLKGSITSLTTNGVSPEDIITRHVPGSYELPQAAAMMIDSLEPDAVICIGCVIQGETRHFEFICQAVANGCMELGIESATPVIFGVLTTDTYEQAKERAGGSQGNKGEEAAIAALRMAALRKNLEE